ncbi:unnamed protein product, partial [marine sediment metagenome]
VKEQFGAEAILIGQGTGRDFESHFSRFGNMLGTPNMITAGHMCYLSRIAAALTTCGRHPAIDYGNNPKCIVMWGCNPLWTNPDEYKGVSFWRAYQKGAKLIVIDPRKGPQQFHVPNLPSRKALAAHGCVILWNIISLKL